MGSIVMEPNDIATYAGGSDAFRNFTAICTSAERIYSKGIFYQTNPLTYTVPLLFLQFSIAAGIIILISLILKPFGQPLVVSQILGGILLGPSGLGRNTSFTKSVFPLRGFILLDIISSFGFMFYFFLIGVQMDPWILKKINKKSFAIGFSAVALPLALTMACFLLISCFFDVDPKLAGLLPVIAQAESVLAFPMVAYLLSELKIINSEYGRIAMSASMVSGLFGLCVITLSMLSHEAPGDTYGTLSTISTGIAVAVVIIFVVRPAVLWMVRKHPEGEPIKENYIIALFIGILITGFCCQATGLHIYFGPLILGITIPAGPPVGSAVIEKLEYITSWIFMPVYFLKNGLVVDIFAVSFKTFAVVLPISLVGALGKFFGAFLASLYCEIPVRDAIALGLVLNVQGVLELGMFKMMKNNKTINNEAFVVMCISLLIITGVLTPSLRYIYNPSRKYVVYNKRTVMHSRCNSELRVIVCIHEQENVPISINLLEALNPTKRSPLDIYLLHLVELAGIASPLLIPHKLTRRPSYKASSSGHIINAFVSYENNNHGLVNVHPFTAISPCETMHDDVCTIALDKKASLVVVPFYKKLLPCGATESQKRIVRVVNNNILEKAPCSVAILVDRGLLKSGPRPILASCSSFHVAVLFLGGPDDREVLAIAARMSGLPNVNLTIIRLLEKGSVSSGDVHERKLDNKVVSEFRLGMEGNYQVMYIEEVVMDGSGTVAAIRSMENSYELIMVGRRHDKGSQLLLGLTDWNEHKELGAIGEILASADFVGNTTILVVQQHTNVARQGNEINTESLRHSLSVKDDAENIPIQRRPL
ncbi:Cation/H(+) antiporter 15 [Quillaja saponaria]|uniref:Cation/H(+) antiporter 15 n=1 Tax=Quillaja saponaria TaxID=32244 RepID=A0AAD7VDE7_QUISA|nr:Cation/H(+) antiporter 15 [Quillaja saponaria]